MSEVHKLTINATDIEIDSSSSINVLGRGYHTHYTYDPVNSVSADDKRRRFR